MSSPHYTLNFICGLCHSVLKEPQQTSCCGSHYCRKCISDKISIEGNTCPECNNEELKYFQDIHFGRLVRSTLGACSKKGCSATVDVDLCEPSVCGTDLNMPQSSGSENDPPKSAKLCGRDIKDTEDCPAECSNLCEDGLTDCGLVQNCSLQSSAGCASHLDDMLRKHMKEASDHVFNSLSAKLDDVSNTYETQCTEIERRQEKIEEMLDVHKKVLQALCSKLGALQKQISSHALLPYCVTVPNIDSYIEGKQGDEWNSPEFYTGTLSNKGYKLQLSIVPHSLYMHNKEKSLSARLLIAKGEEDDKLTWPFHATYKLAVCDPSDTKKPYIVVGRHTWESPKDESSMQFKACITHKDLLKYVKYDNCLHVHVQDH